MVRLVMRRIGIFIQLDVRCLVDDDSLLEDLANVAADYNMAQLVVVDVPEAGKVCHLCVDY